MKNDIEYLPKITNEQSKDTFVQPPKKHFFKVKNDIEYLPKITNEQFKDTFVQPPKKHFLNVVIPELDFSGHVFFNSLSEIIPVFDDLNLNPQYLLLDDHFKTTTKFQLKQVLTAFENNVSIETLLGAQLVIDHDLAKDFYTAIQFYQIYYYCSELDLEKLNSAKSAKTPLIQLGSSYFNDPTHYKPKYSSEVLELIFKAPFKKHCLTATYTPLAQDIQISFDTTNELNVILSNPDFVFDGYSLDRKFYLHSYDDLKNIINRMYELEEEERLKIRYLNNLPETNLTEDEFIEIFSESRVAKKHRVSVIVKNMNFLEDLMRFDTYDEIETLIKEHNLVVEFTNLDDEFQINSVEHLNVILDLLDNQELEVEMIHQLGLLVCDELCDNLIDAQEFHKENVFCHVGDTDKFSQALYDDLDLILFGDYYYLNK